VTHSLKIPLNRWLHIVGISKSFNLAAEKGEKGQFVMIEEQVYLPN
jgi:hypothetical protein